MKKLILVNLKMYLNNLNDINNYIENIKEIKENIIVFPQTLYAYKFISENFKVGTQNISEYENGAHTGEISAKSLKDMKINYTIIAHSETNANDKIVNKKIKIALKNNLKVILCIGENKEEYDQNKTKQIIKNKLKNYLKDIDKEIIISYEPVWSIGTNKTPTNEEIYDTINYIKSLFNYKIKVLYGGSVSEKNIKTLNQIKNIDGFLIGRAGTHPKELKKIIEVTQK